MSSSNKPVRIKRELPSDDDESKPTVQSGAASTFAGPVKLEETASQVCHVFGHMAKCTLGPISQVLPVNAREILEENLDELDSPLMELYRTERRLKELEEVKKANILESSSNMSSSNKPVRIKRELPDDDDESKSTVQSGTASSHVRPVIKQEQCDESESKPIHQLEATFAGSVKQENVQVKQEETASPVWHVFGHMAKCTLGNQCTTPNCSSIKAMAKHWLSCASAHCSICAPFQPQSNNPLPVCGQPTPGTETNVPSPNVSQSNVTQPLVSNLQSFSPQSTHTQALRQLLSTLRNNNNPEARQQVLNVLKSQPALMATFIKQRQEAQRQQQQRYFQSYINQSHNSLPQTSRQIISCPQTNVPTKLNETFSNYNYNNLGRQVAQLKHQHN